MKHQLIVLITALTLCGNVYAQDASWEAAKKEAIDATRYNPDFIDAAAVSDLDFDPAFGSSGKAIYDFNAAGYTRDWGMRTFTRLELASNVGGILLFNTFRYVAGAHWRNGTWDVAVARTNAATGALVSNTTFPGGKLAVQTTLTQAQDVAFDGSHRLYFTGQSSQLFFGNLFTTYCLDINTGAACAGFASGSVVGYSYTLFDVPGGDTSRVGSIARRIVYDPAGYLFIGGESNLAIGTQLALTKIDAATGHTVTSFGTNGNATQQIYSSTSNRLSAMALRLANAPGGYRLYVAGQYQATSPTDYDGFIASFSPTTGNLPSGGIKAVFYEADNTPGFKNDSVTAITVLANGKIAFAGNSESSHAGVPATLLGRVSDGAGPLVYDLSFCNGGLCAFGNYSTFGSYSNAVSTAIAERPGNRDLVISTQGNVLRYPSGTSQAITVQQFSALGGVRTAQTIGVAGMTGNDTTWAGPGLEVDNGYVTVTGTRLWGPTINDDVDFVVASLKANDSIFADPFGGAHSD